MSKTLVIIPLFNKENTIQRAVQSVMDQDYQNFNLLIVNDGSTDQCVFIVEEFEDSRIQILDQENSGVSAARNAGIRHAIDHSYDVVAFLDGDDYWERHHLQTITSLLLHHQEAGAAGTNYKIKNSSNSQINTRFSNLEGHKEGIITDFFEKNYLNSIFSSSSFAVRTTVLKKMDWYNENYTHGEDTDFFIRLGLSAKVAFSTEKTVIIDKSSDGRSDKQPIKNRKIFDIDAYEHEDVPGLKKYLDLNRFSIALQARMENDIKTSLFYQQKIDLNNLSEKQRKLITMSALQLKALYKTKKFLEAIGLDLRTG